MAEKTKSRAAGLLGNLGLSVFSILLSLVISSLIMLAVGYSPVTAFSSMIDGAFGNLNAFANTLSKAIPLLFCGLSFAFAAKCGMFNIGGESQLYLGALASAWVALLLQGAPRIIVLPACILAGMVAGGLMGSLLGFAKAKLHLNEVIVAIMLNYIVSLFCSYMVNGPLKAEGSMTAQTEVIDPSILFYYLVPRTQLTTALYLALVFAVVMYFFFKKTRAGYNIRAVGQNPLAAKAAGVNMNVTLIGAMAMSGAIAGMAGMTEVFGKYGRFIDGFSPGFGFTGIAVAVLAGNNPFGIILTSILFGAMEAGAMRMSYVAGISTNMVMVIQGLVILFVATPNIARSILRRRKGAKQYG